MTDSFSSPSLAEIEAQLAKQAILPMQGLPVCAKCKLGFKPDPDPTAARQNLCGSCGPYGEAGAATATASRALHLIKSQRGEE